MWPTAIRKLKLTARVGAASVLALLATSFASYAGDQVDYVGARDFCAETDGADYDSGDANYNRTMPAVYRRGSGIDAARDAHRRYSDNRAEQLDGACENRVSIKFGESLSDIADLCDVPLAALIDSNPRIYNPNRVSVGEQVYVPNAYGNVYTGGEQGYGCEQTGYRECYTPAAAFERQSDSDYYIVRRGDTLNEITQRFKVSPRDLVRFNPGLLQREIEVGSRIYLPSYARTEPMRRNNWAHDSSQGSKRPVISISPSHGPRNGEVRVIGDNFRRGEQVSVLYGESRNRLIRIRTIEADREGRINEFVKVPATYNQDEVFFAIQRDADTFMSKAYAVDSRVSGIGDLSKDFRNGADRDYDISNRGGRSARLTAVDQDVRWDDKVSLTAQGFPANTIVSIFGGPDRNSMVRLGETRSGPSGRFKAEVSVPNNVDGDSVIFAANSGNGARSYFTERVYVRTDERGGRDAYGHYDLSSSTRTEAAGAPVRLAAATPTILDRGMERKGKVALLAGFGRKDGLRAKDGVNSGGKSAISGVLTNEGINCPALRDDAGKLYTLLGDLGGFDDGDRVLIRGTAGVDNRICNQSETIQVFTIDKAPW